MGWKEEVRNAPIQTVAAIVGLVGTLVGAGFYFMALSDDSRAESSSESGPPPFIESELPPKSVVPPFMEGK